jgi:hypothetical protein
MVPRHLSLSLIQGHRRPPSHISGKHKKASTFLFDRCKQRHKGGRDENGPLSERRSSVYSQRQGETETPIERCVGYLTEHKWRGSNGNQHFELGHGCTKSRRYISGMKAEGFQGARRLIYYRWTEVPDWISHVRSSSVLWGPATLRQI